MNTKKHSAHIFLGEVYQVLQINVVPVGPNVVVNEKVELILDPIFEDKGQDSGSQLQEKDYTKEHRKLETHKHHSSLNLKHVFMQPRRKDLGNIETRAGKSLGNVQT